ncbi:MAG: DNA polymerase-1, partial [Lentisphaeria bacterium]
RKDKPWRGSKVAMPEAALSEKPVSEASVIGESVIEETAPIRAVKKPLYIIDASIYIFKYYFSMPSKWHASNGRPTETVYGYALWLQRFLCDVAPYRVVACFDESLTTCFRNDICPKYKSTRELPDDDLAFQLLACKKVSELMGITCYASNTYEADDLVGTLVEEARKRSCAYSILTRDKDLAQLVVCSDGCLWDYPASDQLFGGDIHKKMGVEPRQVADLLALVGDVSDDIPGVPGVGNKTAAALLQHLGSWQNIKANIHRITELPIRGSGSLQKKLIEYSDQVDMALLLTTIVTDAQRIDWSYTRRQAPCFAELGALVQGLGFPENFVLNLKQEYDTP